MNKSSEPRLIAVHDLSPEVAGVMGHLLATALETPAVYDAGGKKFRVVNLGRSNVESALASVAISEKRSINSLIVEDDLEDVLCVLSTSGCDQKMLKDVNFMNKAIPILSLPQVWGENRVIAVHQFADFNDFFSRYSVSAVKVSDIYEDYYAERCNGLEATALFIADCVSAFIRIIVQLAALENHSLIQ